MQEYINIDVINLLGEGTQILCRILLHIVYSCFVPNPSTKISNHAQEVKFSVDVFPRTLRLRLIL